MLAILTAVMAPAAVFGIFVLAGAMVAKSVRPRIGAVGSSMFGLAWLGGAAYFTFWASSLHPRFGTVVGIAGVVLSIAAIVWSRAWREWRAITPIALVAAGSSIATIGLFRLWEVDRGPFELAMTRTVGWVLPVDNVLPVALADWMGGDRPPLLSGDWLPSDRPPLQAGLLLLVRGVLGPFGEIAPQLPGELLAFGTSVAAQSMWVVSVVSLMWALGYRTRVAIATAGFVAALPTTYINMVFTWPKLLAGAFIVGALAALVAAVRRVESSVQSVVLAATLTLLAVVSHGGAVFVMPAVLVLAAIVVMRCGWLDRGRLAVGVLVAFVLVYVPWMLFQRFVAPPGDRLLKWHLAGVVDVDDRSFLRALADQYGALSWAQIAQARVSNLATALWPQSLEGVDIWREGWEERAQHAAFFNTAAAIGLSAGLVGVVLAMALIARIRHRRDDHLRDAARLSLMMLACVVLWALVLFQPEAATVHQGSQAWLIVLGAVPFGWVAFKRWRLAVLALLPVQALCTIAVFAPSSFYVNANIDSAAVLALSLGIVGVAAGIVSSRWSDARSVAVGFGTPTAYTRNT